MESKQQKNTTQAVRYDHFGGTDVLYIAEQPLREPQANEVQIRVKAAGINPGEASIREGKMAREFPSTFPSGQGSDFAGVITAVGSGVKGFKEGDEVIGFSNERNSQAEAVVVPADNLTTRPQEVSWEQAGSLFVVGTTAYAAVRAVDIKKDETLIVSAAAGGVGSVVVQLAHNIGAKVIGLASEEHHDWLKQHGAIPVAYGDDMQQRIQQALGNSKADAFIDTFGKGYVGMAINMGIDKNRIDTIIDFQAAEKYGVKTAGNSDAARADVLSELADMIAKGDLELPIARTYPLTEVRQAYQELEQRHTQGKIVLVP